MAMASDDIADSTLFLYCRVSRYRMSASSSASLNFIAGMRSEEHTSELQSRLHLVCRLLLEKKKNLQITPPRSRPDTHALGHDACHVLSLYTRAFDTSADNASVQAPSPSLHRQC